MWTVSGWGRSVRFFLPGIALRNRRRNLRCAQWLLACLAVYSVLPYVAPIPLELSEYPAFPFAMRLWTSPLLAALLCLLSCSGVAACSYGMTFTRDGALVSHRVRFTSRQLQQKSFLQFIFTRFRDTAARILRRSTQPSLVGIAMVGITAILFPLALLPFLPHVDPTRNNFLPFWQVHAGLAVATLPILVFVIQLAGTERRSIHRPVEVLVRYTYVFPIVVFVVTSSAISGLGGYLLWTSRAEPLALCLFLLSLFGATGTFLRLLYLLYRPGRLRQRGLALLRDRFQDCLDESTDTRLARAIVEYSLDRTLVAYSPIGALDSGYLPINALRSGRITDFDLATLETITYALGRSTPSTTPVGTSPSDIQHSRSTVSRPTLILTRNVGDHIHDNGQEVALLDSSVVDLAHLSTLRRRIRRLFHFQSDVRAEGTSDLRLHFDEVKRSLLVAIRDRDHAMLHSGLEVYAQVIDDFQRRLEHLQPVSRTKEAQALYGFSLRRDNWTEIDWIYSDYVELLQEAVLRQDGRTLDALFRFPYLVGYQALEARQLYAVQQFIQFDPLLPYRLTGDLPDDLKKRVLDRLIESLGGFLRFVISILCREVAEDEEHFVDDAGEAIIVVFAALLKAAYDARNLPLFALLMSQLRMAIDRSSRTGLSIDVTLPGVRRVIHLAHLGQFGMYSWVRARHTDHEDIDDVKAWLDTCGEAVEMAELLETYASALMHETQSRLGWDRWLLEEIDGAGFINLEPLLHDGFLLQALRIAGHEPFSVDLPSDLALGRILGDVTAEGGALQKRLDELDVDLTAQLVDGEVDARRRTVERLLRDVHVSWATLWRNRVVSAELDQGRRTDFRDHLVQAYVDGNLLRKIMHEAGRTKTVVEAADAGDKRPWRWVHQLRPREDFVAEATVHIDFAAEQIGRGLGREASERGLDDLVQGACSRRLAREVAAADGISEEIDTLRTAGYDPSVLIMGTWSERQDLLTDPRFEWAEGRHRISGYIGSFLEADVYDLYIPTISGALIVDLRRYADWVDSEGAPVDGANDLESPVPGLAFGLNDVDVEVVRAQPEAWLREMDDGRLETIEDALERLRRRVQFRVLFGVECSVLDKDAAVYVYRGTEDNGLGD